MVRRSAKKSLCSLKVHRLNRDPLTAAKQYSPTLALNCTTLTRGELPQLAVNSVQLQKYLLPQKCVLFNTDDPDSTALSQFISAAAASSLLP